MQSDTYVRDSLELHLFFGRIMKEHAFFLRAGMMPEHSAFVRQAEFYQRQFEQVLCQTILLSSDVIRREALCSGEFITPFTEQAEQQTARVTAMPINSAITREEQRLVQGCHFTNGIPANSRNIGQLNQRVLTLLNGFIAFQETILKNVLCCNMFTTNYPSMIEHLICEAQQYRAAVQTLLQECALPDSSAQETECFWNQIMMEHAQFIRGMLDPTETKLLCTADAFAREYAELLEACRKNCCQPEQESTLDKTIRFRDFKQDGVQGIEDCEIRSVILPLLADHVLREANHYIRLLECGE